MYKIIENIKKVESNHKEILLFIPIFLMGIIFTLIVPPFQKADETAHFLRSVTVSRGQLVCMESEDGKKYFELPQKYFDYIRNTETNRVAFHYEEKFHFTNLINAEKKGQSSEKESIWEGYCMLPFIPYLPSASMIFVGEIFNSISTSFYLGRFSSFLLFFLSLTWSYQKIKKSKLKWILFAYALIPMVLHQVTGIGYDSTQLSLITIIFALNVHFVENKNSSKGDFRIYIVSMILLLLVKPGFYFLSLLYLLIPAKKIHNDRKFYIFFTVIYFVLSFGSAVLFTKYYSETGLLEGTGGTDPLEQLKLVSDPSFLIFLIKNTIETYSDFYIKSFIGLFGWLDYGLHAITYILFLLFWILVARELRNSEFFTKLKSKIFLLGLILFLSIGFIFGSIYLSWNTVGNPVISGVQGRYFLVLFPFVLVFISGMMKVFEMNKRFKFFFILLVFIYLLLEITYVIYDRYYDYSLQNMHLETYSLCLNCSNE